MKPRSMTLPRLAALAGCVLAWCGLHAAPVTEPGPRPALSGRSTTAEDPFQARVIVKYRADSAMRRVLSATGREGGPSPTAGSPAGTRPVPLHAARLATAVRAPLRDGRVLGTHIQSLRASGLSSSELVRRLRALPEVEWAVVDERRHAMNLPNDPLFGEGPRSVTPAAGQWYLRTPDAQIVSAINAVGAWSITTGSPNLIVAVLDTGIRPEHEDLRGKLVPGYDFVRLDRDGSAETANDGDGRDADPTDPGDATDAGQCGTGERASASSWHGTQVAGLIGASTDNGIGMAGAGWNVKVLPVRVLGRCGGYDSDIIAGMRWAAGVSDNVGFGTVVTVPNANPARVINMSLGSTGRCTPAYQEVINELNAAGVTTVVAAGNETGVRVGVPANCDGAIGVAGIRHLGTKVGYSNIGPEVALAAPAGNCVNLRGSCLYPLLTTVNLGLRSAGQNGYSDGENFTVGTSFAAPLVSATAALMLSVDPELTPSRIREILRATTRPFPTTRPPSPDDTAPPPVCRVPQTDTCDLDDPNSTCQLECFCTTETCGSGMLDASAAVARVRALRPPPVEPPAASGGSGGGFSGLGWLFGLLLGVGALHRLNRRGGLR